mmetsp:Transcript_80054/g.138952  ORF Transcript_80054/g.138952 Transcript_80054/m.138952 type:complete len:827 (-) Transcript_80054:32-2512(-)
MPVIYQLSPAGSRETSPSKSPNISPRWSFDTRCRHPGCSELCGHQGFCLDHFMQKTTGSFIRYVEDEVQTACKNIAGHDTLISSLKKDIANIRDSSHSLLNQLSSDCCRVDQALSKIETDMSDMKFTTLGKQDRIESFMSEINTLGCEMQKQNNLIQDLREQLANERAETERSHTQVDELERSLLAQHGSNAELENVKQLLAASRDEAKRAALNVKELERARSDDTRLISELRCQVDSAAMDNSSLFKERLENAKLKEKMVMAQKQQAANKSLESSVNELTSKLKDATCQLKLKDQTIFNLEDDLSKERARAQSNKERLEDLERSLKENRCSQVEFEHLRQQLVASQEEARRTALHLAELERVNSEGAQTVTELRSRVSKLSLENSTLFKQRLETVKLKEISANSQSQQLMIAELQTSVNELTSKLQEAGSQLTQKDQSIHRLQEDLSKERTQSQAFQARFDEVEHSFRGQHCTQSELQKVKQQLAASQLESRKTALHVTELERELQRCNSEGTQLISELQDEVRTLTFENTNLLEQKLERSITKKNSLSELKDLGEAESKSQQAGYQQKEKDQVRDKDQLREKEQHIRKLEDDLFKERCRGRAGQARITDLENQIKELDCSAKLELQKIKEFAQNVIASANAANVDLRSPASPRSADSASHSGSGKVRTGVSNAKKVQGNDESKDKKVHDENQPASGVRCALSESLLSEEDLLKLTPGGTYDLPVWTLKWAEHLKFLIFTGKHAHDGQSIFKFFQEIIQDRKTPMDITKRTPLNVHLKRGPDGLLGVYSGDNRRLVAFIIYQAISRDEVLKVKCTLQNPNDKVRL